MSFNSKSSYSPISIWRHRIFMVRTFKWSSFHAYSVSMLYLQYFLLIFFSYVCKFIFTLQLWCFPSSLLVFVISTWLSWWCKFRVTLSSRENIYRRNDKTLFWDIQRICLQFLLFWNTYVFHFLETIIY